MARLIPITGTVKDYAWGAPGGISGPLGHPPTQAVEAELWLGAHQVAPSRPRLPTSAAAPATGVSPPWQDLAAWERVSGQELPFLLKLLAVGAPLSLQAHPGAAHGAAGYAREEAAGVGLTEARRHYRDGQGKPELLVAVEDGFHGLCGFRPLEETRALLDRIAGQRDEPALRRWQAMLTGTDDDAGALRAAVSWLLGAGSSARAAVDALVAALDAPAFRGSAEQALVSDLAARYPGDPGIALTVMLNQVRLRAGEALWLPPGQIHCYLSGLGVELMGPSDTVLRGGLTNKHIDVAELLGVLDFTPGPAARLVPVPLGAHAAAYRPRTLRSGADVPFELVHVTGDAQLETGTASIALVLEGDFEVSLGPETRRLRRGEACFVDQPSALALRGSGSLYLATARAR